MIVKFKKHWTTIEYELKDGGDDILRGSIDYNHLNDRITIREEHEDGVANGEITLYEMKAYNFVLGEAIKYIENLIKKS